ncbi:hypothetical protein [Amphibacillus cookii]|uniref:hypothetical protein n=1 Tax=Amphibacillus cookii TaxID=767787 RepID=UPI0019580C26|nr:hypothetical protein [Amphibacillus cookii]MBM7541648.1 ABC-type transport system involved in multi-copper enzyme maturation permease subunit [Amphibacillus cookii]
MFITIVLLLVYINQLPTDMTMRELVFEELEGTWGGPVTEEKVELARESMHASDTGEISNHTFESKATDYVQFLIVGAAMQKQDQNERLTILEAEMNDFDESTYKHRKASMERDMLQELDDAHGFYLIRSWREMFEFIEPVTHVLLLSILIFLGLSPVFAEEYTHRTTDLILATKHGKTKLVTAKILAALSYIVIIFLSLQIINSFLNLLKFGGIAGWDAPIQGISSGLDSLSRLSYDGSPYNFEVWQFFLLTMGLQLLSCIVIAALVLLLSFLTKNTMITFFISSIIIAIPALLQQLGITDGFLGYLTDFSFLKLMQVSSLFTQFQAYNVFGYPVLYPSLLFTLFALVTGLLIMLIYRLFRNQQVSH